MMIFYLNNWENLKKKIVSDKFINEFFCDKCYDVVGSSFINF